MPLDGSHRLEQAAANCAFKCHARQLRASDAREGRRSPPTTPTRYNDSKQAVRPRKILHEHSQTPSVSRWRVILCRGSTCTLRADHHWHTDRLGLRRKREGRHNRQRTSLSIGTTSQAGCCSGAALRLPNPPYRPITRPRAGCCGRAVLGLWNPPYRPITRQWLGSCGARLTLC